MNLIRLILLIAVISFGISKSINAQWFWQNPLPTGQTLKDVYVFDEHTSIAVGEAGTIIKKRMVEQAGFR